MAITGVIAGRVKGIIPITWDALINDPRYGETPLQSAIDLAKEQVTDTVVAPSTEVDYPLWIQDYIAKLAALEIIPGGVDFWGSEPISETAAGTNEAHTFVDRVDKLYSLREALLKETREKAAEVALYFGVSTQRGGVPSSNMLTEDFITPSPLEFPRPFRVTTRT